MEDINQKVLLLGIYKKERGETLLEVIYRLSNTGMFTPKEGKIYLKLLQKNQYLEDGELTFKGVEQAKIVEKEFRL